MDYIDQALGDCGQSTSIESLFPHIEETDTFNILKECDIDVVSLSPPANGNNGIEAFDVSSLFEQFEASQVTDEDLFDLTSLGGTEQESDPVEISPILKNEPVAEECIVTTPPKKPNKDDTATQEIVEKIKSGNKPKTTVLLPLGVPLKQGKYSEIPQTNCTSKQVQRILKAHRHKSLINSKSSKKPDSNTVSVPKTSLSSHLVTDGPNKTALECAKYSPENDANNNLIHDHDYCSNLNRKPLSVSESENPNNLQSSFKDDESGDDSQKSVCFSEQSSSNSTDFGENCLSSNKENKEVKKISVSDYFQKFTKMKEKYKRNYRKSNKQDSDDEQYFDKIPTYYTALSIPGRTTKSKIDIRTCSADHIDRDPSPTRRTKDNLYNKIPDYHSCFTNSTKYDATALEKNGNSFPKYPWDEMRTSSLSNSASSSRSHSPVSYSRRYSRSPTRSSSRGRSYSRSRSRSRDKRRSWRPRSRSRSRSYSSYSRSSCSSHSRSRSRSRSRYRYSRSRSRYSRSCSRYRRSCSRYSRSRSRSPLYDRNRRYASRKSRSLSPASIRFREERKKAKEDRKQRQMDERRIVYVGRLPDNHTKRLLRQRFEKFGEIEEIGIHFREHGDNYGFVTFVYSCDAFAAVSKGNDIPGEPEFDLCFGGRRHFCESEYADLDGDMEIDEEYDPFPKKDTGLDFDALLKQAQKKIKKK